MVSKFSLKSFKNGSAVREEGCENLPFFELTSDCILKVRF